MFKTKDLVKTSHKSTSNKEADSYAQTKTKKDETCCYGEFQKIRTDISGPVIIGEAYPLLSDGNDNHHLSGVAFDLTLPRNATVKIEDGELILEMKHGHNRHNYNTGIQVGSFSSFGGSGMSFNGGGMSFKGGTMSFNDGGVSFGEDVLINGIPAKQYFKAQNKKKNLNRQEIDDDETKVWKIVNTSPTSTIQSLLTTGSEKVKFEKPNSYLFGDSFSVNLEGSG